MKIEDVKMDVKALGNYATIAAWAVDFVYALEARPWICKWLFKLAIGRFAWREFTGMVEAGIVVGSFVPRNVGYCHEQQSYHQEHPELWGLR